MKTKPFNLEECLAWKPMVTRDGRKAKLVNFEKTFKKYPLLVEIEVLNMCFTKEGKCVFDSPTQTPNDLFMVDESEDSQHEAGVKLDHDKIPVRRGLLEQFPKACLAVAEVSAFGAKKYTWGGWQHVEDGINRYGDAEMRHALQNGVDDESGLLHAAHEAWNALARLELILRSK